MEGLNIAFKDTTRSAFDMWASLLSTSAPVGQQQQRSGRAGGGGGSALEALMGSMSDFGDSELVRWGWGGDRGQRLAAQRTACWGCSTRMAHGADIMLWATARLPCHRML